MTDLLRLKHLAFVVSAEEGEREPAEFRDEVRSRMLDAARDGE